MVHYQYASAKWEAKRMVISALAVGGVGALSEWQLAVIM